METEEDWYNNAGRNLHLVDLLFQSHIQTARRMSQWVDRFPNRDRVLEHLMTEGLFDRREPDHEHIAEMRANWLSVALTEQVLEQVENVEGRVRIYSSSDAWPGLNFSIPRWETFVLGWMTAMHLIQISMRCWGDWRP